ncbi:hypothetical protein ACLOJK_021143 [Asimina triloba]
MSVGRVMTVKLTSPEPAAHKSRSKSNTGTSIDKRIVFFGKEQDRLSAVLGVQAQKYGRTSKEEESACECLSRWCCAHLLDCCKSKEEESNREVAVCLSGYCAYLVAFVPALLPDPTDAAELVFDQAILDARELLGKCRDLGGVYRELRKVGKKEVALTALGKKNRADGGVKAVEVGEFGEKVVVAMGAKLGMQLLSETRNDEKRLWKVLVDFWAEMMLFLAPSNNVTAHAKSLANGGEIHHPPVGVAHPRRRVSARLRKLSSGG